MVFRISLVVLLVIIIRFTMAMVWDNTSYSKEGIIEYPYAKLVNRERLIVNNNNVEVFVYASRYGTQDDVFSLLEDKFKKAGWVEKERIKPYSLYFKKNKNELKVQIVLPTIIYYAGSNISPVKDKDIDNFGYDFKSIPRPQNSIRIMSLKRKNASNNYVNTLIYKTNTNRDFLKKFYENDMKKKGWIENYQNNNFMIFEKKGFFLLISLYTSKKHSYVVIQTNVEY